MSFGITLAVVAALAAAPPPYSIGREAAGGTASPQVVVLRDRVAGVEAAVAPSEGGELSSLKVRFRGAWVELLYRAREHGPPGKAPILWPAVGGQYPVGSVPESACSDGAWVIGQRSYPMPCHGFAKDVAWEEIAASADGGGARVAVELRDSAWTRARYPFGFRLRATYELAGPKPGGARKAKTWDSLRCPRAKDAWGSVGSPGFRAAVLSITYTVYADSANAGPMPFSIGNHLTLRLPFVEGTEPADMLFETPSTSELRRDSHGLVTTEERQRSFAVPQRLGDFDSAVALPLAGYRGVAYARLRDPQGLAVRISHRGSSQPPEPLVQFNVYGGPRQGFFCPEPWFGLQNSLNQGVGLVRLAPGASWEWKIEMELER